MKRDEHRTVLRPAATSELAQGSRTGVDLVGAADASLRSMRGTFKL
jgi:hypothetical protein